MRNIVTPLKHYVQDQLNSKKFIPGTTYIHASGAKIYPEDVETLIECALGMWYTEHKYSTQFKASLRKFIDDRLHITLCNSGSSASLLAMTAAVMRSKKRQAEYVITCATGFPTTVSPIYQNGKIPYYVDIDPKTLSPNLDQIEYVLNHYRENVCGVILAHNLGFPFAFKNLSGLIRNEFVISDNCDAFGAGRYVNGQLYPVGSFADYSTYSFFPAHHITTGEGGAVCAYDEQDHKLIEKLCSWGRSCSCAPGHDNTCGKRFDWKDRGTLPDGWDHKYIFDCLGYNFKMTDLQAALGLAQMEHAHEFVNAREANYDTLRDFFHEQQYVGLDFIEISKMSKPSPFGFPIIVLPSAPFTLNELIQYLEEHKVGTRRVFGGNLTRQPAFMKLSYAATDLSGSDYVMNQMFWIGCHPAMTYEMLVYIMETFDAFMEKYK